MKDINWRYVFGTITIVTVVGVTIYSMKKARDQKYIDENSMTHEEVMAEFNERKKREDEILHKHFDEFDKIQDIKQAPMNFDAPRNSPPINMQDEVDDIHDHVQYNASFGVYEDTTDLTGLPITLDEDSPAIFAEDVIGYTYDGIDMHIPIKDTMTEEDTILRHDPNSNEARTQFIKMQLAEWAPSDPPYGILIKLFDQPFLPTNHGDQYLKENLEEPRENFFGRTSRWVKEVSMADVLIHYAHKAQYELDEDVTYWMDQFLHHNEFKSDMPQRFMRQIVSELNNHEYHNSDTDTYGIFGLSPDAIDEAEHYASKNLEHCLTYDLQFSEFIKERIE